jgi:hypothetical protein
VKKRIEMMRGDKDTIRSYREREGSGPQGRRRYEQITERERERERERSGQGGDETKIRSDHRERERGDEEPQRRDA